jgi:hypothetical protein
VAWLGFGIIVVVACVVAGLRGQHRSAFVLAIAACLMTTPIIWLHYFALLLVALALTRPKLSSLWFVPLLLQFPASTPGTAEIVAALVTLGVITAVALTEPKTLAPQWPTRANPNRTRALQAP